MGTNTGWASAGWATVTPDQLRQAGITPERFNQEYQRATVHQAERRKDGLWLEVGPNHKRPFVRRSLR